jgi:hypothetical protein
MAAQDIHLISFTHASLILNKRLSWGTSANAKYWSKIEIECPSSHYLLISLESDQELSDISY